MDDLARWLGAQLDEDERALRAGLDAAVPPSGHVMQDRVLFGGLDRGVPEPIMDAYVLFGDPARVLREIDAKRRQVEWCVEVIGDRDLSRYGEFGSLKHDPQALAVTLAVETLRLLALPYADRPDYRAEWAPTP